MATSFAHTFVQECARRKLQPGKAQGIVGVGAALAATQYDLLLIDEKGDDVMVEVKTDRIGEQAFRNHGGQMMRGALQHVPCSRLNMAKLQAAVTADWYRQTEGREVSRLYVARVGLDRCDFYPVADRWVSTALKAVSDILEERKTLKAKKGAKPKSAPAAKKQKR
jgi:hypothetical protein